MYKNYNKKPTNDSRFFLITVAVIVVLLTATAVCASPDFFVRPLEPTPLTPVHTIPPLDTTTLPPETTASKGTETLPFDTATDAVTETSAPETTSTDTTASDITEETTTAGTAAPIQATAGLAPSEDAGQAYIDKIIFLGDSTTYSFLYYEKLSGGKDTKQVWTPASRTLTLDHATTTTILYPDTGEEITIKAAVEAKKPEIMVITLGVNGISYMNEAYFTSSYTKLIGQIKEASPETKIILQSIYPVAANWEKTKSINNDKINTANIWVQAVAAENEVGYLDTISVLAVGEDGYLPESYQNGDGLHLSPAALDIVLTYIRTHALPDYAAPLDLTGGTTE